MPFGERSGEHVRRAVQSDVPRLAFVAHEAKRHWKYPAEWMEAWRHILTPEHRDLETHRVFVAEHEGCVVGFCAVAPTTSHWSLDHLWVLPAFMGRGIGSALFDAASQQVLAENGMTLVIESDPNAEGFYLKKGAKRVGRVAAHVGGIERYLPLLEIEIK